MANSQRKDAPHSVELDAVIDRFDGDVRAALEAALHDITFLQQELSYAGLAMSYGFARGWTPATNSGGR